MSRRPVPASSDELHESSALAQLSVVLPTLTLTRSYRPGGEDLAELVNRRFYGGRIASLPWAGTFLGHGSISLEYVADGHGLPDPDSGAVISPDAEVARVVELVLEHATTKPHESLMVVTANQEHAVRVLQAVLVAANDRPELADFVIGDRGEPFTVCTIEEAVAESRDRVIFSIGYGRTPHGRVLSDFGSLGEEGGERLLAVAMTRARRSMTIVACFQSADIDEDRMRYGAVALAEILAEVGARYSAEPIPDDSDPMLVDLARRLELKGVKVALGHRGKLGLVASHGGVCATIETDAMLLQRVAAREPAPAAGAAAPAGLARRAGARVRAVHRSGCGGRAGAWRCSALRSSRPAAAAVTEPIDVPAMAGGAAPDPNATQPIEPPRARLSLRGAASAGG